MRIFKAKAARVVPPADDGTAVLDLMGRHGLTYAEALQTVMATESWELMQASSAGVSVAVMAARLDTYDAAVAREGWRARVLVDAGETGAGMVVAVGSLVSLMVFAVCFSGFVGVAS